MWSDTDFTTNLLSPFLSTLFSRGLTNQIDYVVLSMDIPIQVIGTSDVDSTTASLFYGFKTNGPVLCPVPLPPASTSNSYAASEGIFRSTPPTNPNSNSFLVMMITGNSLSDAKMVVDQGVLGDSSFPTQTVYLAKSTDTVRNVRFQEYALRLGFSFELFDHAVGKHADWSRKRVNLDSPRFDSR